MKVDPYESDKRTPMKVDPYESDKWTPIKVVLREKINKYFITLEPIR